jgi:hypothetical protein
VHKWEPVKDWKIHSENEKANEFLGKGQTCKLTEQRDSQENGQNRMRGTRVRMEAERAESRKEDKKQNNSQKSDQMLKLIKKHLRIGIKGQITIKAVNLTFSENNVT